MEKNYIKLFGKTFSVKRTKDLFLLFQEFGLFCLPKYSSSVCFSRVGRERKVRFLERETKASSETEKKTPAF